MKTLLLSLLALAGTSGLKADLIAEAYKSTATVKVDGIEIREIHLLFTEKPAYIHVVVDAFPYRKVIAARGAAFQWARFCESLAKDVIFARYPKRNKAVVAVLEYPERDDYGAPRWDKLVKKGSFEVKKKGKKITVKAKK